VAEPADPDHQLEELCRVLNYFRVGYIVFGSHVARLNGVPVETVDVDVVPARMVENLTRLAEALNLLRPRWRVEGIPEGMKIDGGLEARHFLGDSAAIGLVTRLGPVDVVLEPQGLRGRLHRAHRRVDEGAPRRCRDPGRGPRRPHPVEGATAPGQGRRAPGRPVPAVPRACSRVATRASRPPVTAVAFRILHGSSSQALIAEHGLSMLVTISKAGHEHRVLFDTGASPNGVLENMRRLDIDPSSIEAIVCSHGHFDHTAGLDGLLRVLGLAGMPVLIHPHFWRRRRVVLPGREPVELPTTNANALREAGFDIVEY
jgi:hypothetical protein